MTHPANSAQPNRLAKEKSPYLLQHAANPVDWYAWGPEAFEKAKKENKLIFLSIGYSTCHWCHVMAHESFEDEEIAKLLNADFVSIKVDREERPDIDQLYMTAVQAMTGSGGWPLTAFLTPEGQPVAGGTYFPPEDRWGRAGMKTLLPRLAQAWKEKPEEMTEAGRQMSELLKTKSSLSLRAPEGRSNPDFEIASSASPPRNDTLLKILQKGFDQFASRFDSREGGFGGAPKFPRSHDITFLLGFWKRSGEKGALEMAEVTLDHMARGGIYDQLGGGFHRYSTDEHWLVPHFEKMLYDQAILAQTYLFAFQETRNLFYADTARGIFRYVLRDMTDSKGGFYSAEDADSEGEEGKFYVWRPEEITQVLGSETGRLFNEFYGVTDSGNFEHAMSILHVVSGDAPIGARHRCLAPMGEACEKLFQVREKRIHPHKDDKILTAWNGMMISALAHGAQILNDPLYAEAATRSAEFILSRMQRDGRLLRRYRDGEAAILGYQEDYAYFGLGLLDLYEATFDTRWLTEARRLAGEMLRLFWDEEGGGFYFTASDSEPLLARSKEYYDGAMPSGNSIAALLMLRLGRMLADSDLEKKAEVLMQSNAVPLSQYPMAYPQLLSVLDFALGPAREIILAGDRESADFKKALEIIRSRFWPNQVLVYHPVNSAEAAIVEALAGYLKNQPALGGKLTVYVCENHVCRFPVSDLAKLEAALS